MCVVDDGLLVSNSLHICVLEQWVHRLGDWVKLRLSGDAKVQGGVWSSWTRFLIVYVVEW